VKGWRTFRWLACALSAIECGAGCSAPAGHYDRARLPVARTFANVASVEYFSEWSDVLFEARSNEAIVAVVSPQARASEAVARGLTRTETTTTRDAKIALPGAQAGASSRSASANGTRGTRQASSDRSQSRGAPTAAATAATALSDSAGASTKLDNRAASTDTRAERSTSAADAVRGSERGSTAIGTAGAAATRGAVESNVERGELVARTERAVTENAAARGNTITSALRPELRIEKSVSPTRALPGDRITYVLHIRNVGELAVAGGTVRDRLPAEVELKDSDGLPRARSTGPRTDDAKRDLRFTLPGPFPPGAVRTLSLTVRVRPATS
jgi:uncharacterized repeat protein (TIGR01451 family)